MQNSFQGYRIMIRKTNQKFACMNPSCFRQIGFGEGSPRTRQYFANKYSTGHSRQVEVLSEFPVSILVPCTEVVHAVLYLFRFFLLSSYQAHLPNSARWAALTLIDVKGWIESLQAEKRQKRQASPLSNFTTALSILNARPRPNPEKYPST